MTQEEILEGNTLIAGFMDRFASVVAYTAQKGIDYDWRKDTVELDALEYHSSWDWLMPVVKQLEISGESPPDRLPTDAEVNRHLSIRRIIEMPISSEIDTLWANVVEFIKWDNNQNK